MIGRFIIFITVLLLIVASIPPSITNMESIHNNPYATQQTKDLMDGASMLVLIAIILIILLVVIGDIK